ncbi:hypothetical protein [Gracilibacillus dipsosauri]|uniref:hypothetical protein n=1 Tax=Gracilibacillus dipsosauri TaxID=178340 RepID=UPI002409C5A5
MGQVDKEYAEILDELKKEQIDLVSISKRYRQIKIKDYLQSDLGKGVLKEIQNIRGGID